MQCLDLLVETGRFDGLALFGLHWSHLSFEPIVGGIGRGSDSSFGVTILLLIRMTSATQAESTQLVCAPIEISGGH